MPDIIIETGVSPAQDRSYGPHGPYWLGDVGWVTFMNNSADRGQEITKSTNKGVSFTVQQTITESGNDIWTLSACFDRETPGITTQRIHHAYLVGGINDCIYRSYNTADDTLGTRREVDTTNTVDSTPQNNRITVGISRSGRIYIWYSTQTEVVGVYSDDDGATWNVIATPFDAATEEDYVLALPANTGDDDDMIVIKLDRSANQLKAAMYDASADTFTETLIVAMVDNATHVNYDAAVRHSDGRVIVVGHTDDDTTGDDYFCFEVNPNSIASPGIVDLGNIDDNIAESAQIALQINQQNDDLVVWVFEGTTWNSLVLAFSYKSINGGSTWTGPTTYLVGAEDDYRSMSAGHTVGNEGGQQMLVAYNRDETDLRVNADNSPNIAAVGTTMPLFMLQHNQLGGGVRANA